MTGRTLDLITRHCRALIKQAHKLLSNFRSSSNINYICPFIISWIVYCCLDRDFILKRQKELQDYISQILENPELASNINTQTFFDPENNMINFQGLYHFIVRSQLIFCLELALQHVSLVLRSNQQYEIQKHLPDIGSQIRNCYYLVRDSQEAKVQKILQWSDFGPLRSLEDKSIQSLLKSISQIEVNRWNRTI